MEESLFVTQDGNCPPEPETSSITLRTNSYLGQSEPRIQGCSSYFPGESPGSLSGGTIPSPILSEVDTLCERHCG